MSLLLNIETSGDRSSIALSENGNTLSLNVQEKIGEQRGWPHFQIAGMLKKNGKCLKNLQAVAVAIGPGSYTGLRVGLATAKGLCFALQIPLIAVNTLRLIAHAASAEAEELICPLIDARRTEVFTALYSLTLEEIIAPHVLLLNEGSYSSQLTSSRVLFCGNGAEKLKGIISTGNATFSARQADASHLAQLADIEFSTKNFADLAYCEPFYAKEFYVPPAK